MDVSYYYQILDMGIRYEKGRKVGKHWRIGERKRLGREVLFWESLLGFIAEEEQGIECADQVFEEIGKLCKRYRFPNYERVLEKKDELRNSRCIFEREKEEEKSICALMKALFRDMRKNLKIHKGKEKVYHILMVLHNLPKAMHGRNQLNNSNYFMSYQDALSYAWEWMDDKMREEYGEFFQALKR